MPDIQHVAAMLLHAAQNHLAQPPAARSGPTTHETILVYDTLSALLSAATNAVPGKLAANQSG